MFQSWRLKLREAEAAYRGGQLDEASRLLVDQRLRDYRPGRRLGLKVADEFARRGRRLAELGDTAAGWHDLSSAKRLGGDTETVLTARRAMVDEALQAVECSLAAGDGAAALARLERLQRRDIAGERVLQLRRLALCVDRSARLAKACRFADAVQQLEQAAKLAGQSDFLASQRERYRTLEPEAEQLTQKLHQQLTDRDWGEVLRVAEQLLRIAPESATAHEARRLAWRRVGAKLRQPKPIQPVTDFTDPTDSDAKRAGMTELKPSQEPDANPRFALWVDAVGGYLVATADRVVLGQAVPDAKIEVPIQGDCSREHASICRVAEGYLLEPHAAVLVSGRSIEERTLLRDGDEIQLGESIQFRFRRPHPLSSTARLELISRHRLQPSVDAVLLMAESCVLGPKLHNHVICRDWAEDVVLYRKGNRLFCRGGGELEVDGNRLDGRGPITCRSRITGDDFAISLEEV